MRRFLVATAFFVSLGTCSGAAPPAAFSTAKPIWPAGLDREMNLFVGFRAVINPPPGKPVKVRVAASALYRLFVNGEFRGLGPARAARGLRLGRAGPRGAFAAAGWSTIAASGGSVRRIEYGCPIQGTSSASTPEPLPTLLPP